SPDPRHSLASIIRLQSPLPAADYRGMSKNRLMSSLTAAPAAARRGGARLRDEAPVSRYSPCRDSEGRNGGSVPRLPVLRFRRTQPVPRLLPKHGFRARKHGEISTA